MQVFFLGGGGVYGMGSGLFSQCGRWGKTSAQTFSNRFLKTLIEGAVTTEAGSLSQHHQQGRPSPSAVALTFEYLVDVPS